MPIRTRPRVPGLLLVVGACLLLFGFRLDGTAFRGLYDDVDRALIAREMADSGDWLVPVYHGRPIYTKPPLMYWLAGGAYRLSGRADELPAAAVSVLAMTWVVMATYLAGRDLLGRRGALLAALMLASSHLFLGMARQPLIDTVMMAGFALSFLALVRLLSGAPRRGLWWLLLALGLAWATMTKGPVLLPLLVIMAVPLWWERPRILPSRGAWLGMLALVLVVILPWHVLLFRHAPEAWAVWKSELWGRFGDGQQFHAWTQKPLWFYVPDLVNFAPWVLVLPAGVAHALARRGERRYRLLLWWALGGFALFTFASATKRSYYLLPLYPAFALLAAAIWDFVAEGRPAPGRWTRRLFHGGTSLLLVGLLGLGVAAALAPARLVNVPRWPFLAGGALMAALAAAAAVLAWRGRWRPAVGGSVTAVGIALLLWVGAVVPPLNDYLSGRPFLQAAAPLCDPDERLAICHAQRSLAAFYLGRQDVRVLDPAGVRGWVADGKGGRVLGDPEHLEDIAGLRELLATTLTSPAGETRRLALYALPARPAAGSADGPGAGATGSSPGAAGTEGRP